MTKWTLPQEEAAVSIRCSVDSLHKYTIEVRDDFPSWLLVLWHNSLQTFGEKKAENVNAPSSAKRRK